MKAESQKKTVIFVGSTSRSGSTMLDLMLGTGIRCFSLGEVNAHFRPYRKHHINSICACGNPACSIREKLAASSEESLYDCCFRELEVDVIVDSSKELTWLYDQYNRLAKRKDLEVRIVMIYKNPISLAHSYFKRGEALDKYKHQYKYYSQFLETDLPFVSVEFDDLVKNPSGTLRGICESVGIEYFDGKEIYWREEMHHFFGSGSALQTYNSSEPKIKSTETFREDFLPLVPKIEEEVKGDSELARTTEILLSRNVLVNGALEVKEINYRRIKPIWYYKRKLKAVYNRIFLTEYKGKTFNME